MDNNRSGSYFHQTRYSHHLPNPNSLNPNFYHNPPSHQFRPPPHQPPPPPPPPQPPVPPPPPPPPFNPHLSYSFSNSTPDFVPESRSGFRDHNSRVLHHHHQSRVFHHDPDPFPGSHGSRHELVLEPSRFIEEQKSQRGKELLFGSKVFRISNENDVLVENDLRRMPHHHRSREVIRDVHHDSVYIDRRGSDVTDSDGIRIVKQHYRTSRDVNSEVENRNSGSREGSYEFNHNRTSTTPRKQPVIQKKSALLRIQKPGSKFRIRDDDHRGHHYDSKYASSSSSFRGIKDKDHNSNHHSDRGNPGEQVRDASPVELDVSFKSNSLVAKAIVTPPPADVSGSSLAPRNGKVRKVLVPKKNSSSSSPAKPNKGAVKLSSVVSVPKNTSSPVKDQKKSKEIGKVFSSGGTKVSIGSSKGESASKGKGESTSKGKGENSSKGTMLNKVGANAVTAKASPSVKVVRKKKVVKKAGRKAVNNFNLSSSSSQPTENRELIAAGQPASSENKKGAFITLPNAVDSQQLSTETTKVSENYSEEVLADIIASENGMGDASGEFGTPNKKRKRSHSTSPSHPSGLEETTLNENIVNDDSTNQSHAISNSGVDCTKSAIKTSSSDNGGFEDAGRQLCQNEDSIFLETNEASESPKVSLIAKGDSDFANNSQSLSFAGKDYTELLDETCVSDVGVVLNADKQLCLIGESFFLEKNEASGSPNVLLLATDNSDSPTYLHSASNGGKGCTESPYENISSENAGADNVSQSVDSLLLVNNTASKFPEVLCSFKENADCGNPILETNNYHEGPSNSSNVTFENEHDNGLINSTEERNSVSENERMEVDCNQICLGKGDLSLENFKNVSEDCQLNSEEMKNQNVATHETFTDEGAKTLLGSENGLLVSREINFSNLGENTVGQASPDRVSTSYENIPSGPLNGMVPPRGKSADNSLNDEKKSDEIAQLDFSKSEANDVDREPANKDSAACWVDTTLRLSFKDLATSELTASGDGYGNVGMQPCSDGVNVLPQVNFVDVSDSSNINISPDTSLLQKQKKRKVSDPQLELYYPMASAVFEEEPAVALISASAVEPSSNSGGVTKPQEEATMSADSLCGFDEPLQKENTESLNCSGSHESTMALLRDASDEEVMRFSHSCSTAEELAVANLKIRCSPGFENNQIASATSDVASHQNKSIYAGCGEEEKMDVDAAVEKHIFGSGIIRCQFSSELESPNSDEKFPSVDMEDQTSYVQNYGSPSVPNNLSSLRGDNGFSQTDTSSESMGLLLDTSMDMECSETLPDAPSTSYTRPSIEKVGADNRILLGKPSNQSGSGISSVTCGSLNADSNLDMDRAVENAHSLSGKIGTLLSQDTKSSTPTLKAVGGEISGRKKQNSQAASWTFPSHSSVVFTASKTIASSSHISKPRTWHRTDSSASVPLENRAFSSTVPAQSQLPKKITKLQTNSYIRKGNSLVRKSTSVAAQSRVSYSLNSSVHQLNSSGKDEARKNAVCNTRTSVSDQATSVRSGVSASFERPRTPPLPSNSSKLPNHSANALGEHLSSPLAEPLLNCATGSVLDHMTSPESDDMSISSDDALKVSGKLTIQSGQINNLDGHTERNDMNAGSSNASSVTYVKRKLNQLVAMSNPSPLPMKNSNYTLIASTDGYYKRRKNQLIRSSLDNHVKSTTGTPDDSVNAKWQTLNSLTFNRSLTKKRAHKYLTKARKSSKFSLVWTLNSSQLSNNRSNPLHHKKILPQLFPWKRATYWRSFMPSLVANSINASSSAISGKLQLLRKRDTLYTRSKHGFSLRKSKVLSVGGSSLKWSKSIERQSKKANEEATLAVAEAERKRREKSGASGVGLVSKSRNSSSREWIFRIGSVRYKMDPSRRTLQRISDDESSCSAAPHTEKDVKRSYVPRRLVIGKDEYVRIGNGNQLVRNPKKRTRILASEKVRWSLHTARSRLAKKRKYCQFFTRFGKCNKDDGKCPYIHDSSKIAVCTKFLNGLCFNSDCKLTHKVIPERMPDCSYFLQGLCSNKNCPYRHVHVNPKSSACEGFLRGYCADGNECRKKHSYVCPTYEATGSCPQGSKCKLHHPKKSSKGKKNKRLREKKNGLGRYFGSMRVKVSDPGSVVSRNPSVEDCGNFCFEGSIADYISLDAYDEAAENCNPVDEQISLSDNDLDLHSDDFDELIKPIRIMNT